jgi:cell division protein FtsN
MPNREPELYKDKIEVSLDGRQIFYLFFGGAAIVGLVFVLGVIVGRRIEARGHLDRAGTQAASDPLAALDRLERPDNLSFQGALTGSEARTDVEKAIGELEKRRVAGKADGRSEPSATPNGHGDGKPVKAEARAEAPDENRSGARGNKPVTRPDAKADGKASAKADGKPSIKADGKPGIKVDGKPGIKADGKPGIKADGKAEGKVEGKAEGKVEGKAEGKAEGKVDGKVGFTLQLSSFQDKAEAEVFLAAMKVAGYEPYLTEANVSGRGRFYRVRLGSYRSLEAAQDARGQYERAVKKTAQIIQL